MAAPGCTSSRLRVGKLDARPCSRTDERRAGRLWRLRSGTTYQQVSHQRYYEGWRGQRSSRTASDVVCASKVEGKEGSDCREEVGLSDVLEELRMLNANIQALREEMDSTRKRNKSDAKKEKKKKKKDKVNNKKEGSSSSSSSSSESEDEADARLLRSKAQAQARRASLPIEEPAQASSQGEAVDAMQGMKLRCTGIIPPTISVFEHQGIFRAELPLMTSTLGSVEVCGGKSCGKRGSEQIQKVFEERTVGLGGIEVGQCKCMGKCGKGPAVRIKSAQGGASLYAHMEESSIDAVIEHHFSLSEDMEDELVQRTKTNKNTPAFRSRI